MALRITQQWFCFKLSWPKGLGAKGQQQNDTGRRPTSSLNTYLAFVIVKKSGKHCLSFAREVLFSFTGQRSVYYSTRLFGLSKPSIIHPRLPNICVKSIRKGKDRQINFSFIFSLLGITIPISLGGIPGPQGLLPVLYLGGFSGCSRSNWQYLNLSQDWLCATPCLYFIIYFLMLCDSMGNSVFNTRKLINFCIAEDMAILGLVVSSICRVSKTRQKWFPILLNLLTSSPLIECFLLSLR